MWDAGVDVPLARDALHLEFDPSAAGEWWAAGFSLQDACAVLEQELDLEWAVAARGQLGSTAAVMRRLKAVQLT